MERVGEILSRVLADLQAQFPQEEKMVTGHDATCESGPSGTQNRREDEQRLPRKPRLPFAASQTDPSSV
jgi:hypothetical protein